MEDEEEEEEREREQQRGLEQLEEDMAREHQIWERRKTQTKDLE